MRDADKEGKGIVCNEASYDYYLFAPDFSVRIFRIRTGRKNA